MIEILARKQAEPVPWAAATLPPLAHGISFALYNTALWSDCRHPCADLLALLPWRVDAYLLTLELSEQGVRHILRHQVSSAGYAGTRPCEG